MCGACPASPPEHPDRKSPGTPAIQALPSLTRSHGETEVASLKCYLGVVNTAGQQKMSLSRLKQSNGSSSSVKHWLSAAGKKEEKDNHSICENMAA